MSGELNHYRIRILAVLVTAISLVVTINAQQNVPGMIVEEVEDNSAGAKAGIRIGDRLLAYDNKELMSPAAFLALQENTFGKKEVELSVRRKEETLISKVSIGLLGIKVRPELSFAALKLYQEGVDALQAQKPDEAIARLKEAAKVSLEAGDKSAATWLHGRAAEQFEGQGKWKEAITQYEAALELLKESKDEAAKSRTMRALGRCLPNVNDYSAANQRYEQAQQVDSGAGNQMWLAYDLTNLGRLARTRGDLDVAQDYHTRALTIFERLQPGSLIVATGLNGLGNVAYQRSDLQAAQDYHSRALAIRERLAPNSPDVAASLNNLGTVTRNRGDLQAAQNYFSSALAIFERLTPNSPDVANCLNNLGVVASERGDFQAAQDYYGRDLAITERLAPDSLGVAASLNNLGIVAHKLGDFQAAQDYHSRALEIRERLAPDSTEVATSLNNLGNVVTRRGDFQSAHAYHNRALTISERRAPNSLDVAISLSNLGIVARERGDLQSAQNYYSRALAILERMAPNSQGFAASLSNLGNVAHARGEFQSARDYYGRALAMFERLAPNSLDTVEVLGNLGDVAFQERRFSEARSLFERAINVIESQRSKTPTTQGRALFLARYVTPFTGLLRTHLQLNDVPAAFATSERARARSLVELLAERRLDLRSDAPADLLKQQDELDQKRSATYSALAKLDSGKDGQQIERLQAELGKYDLQQRQLAVQIRRASPKLAGLQYPEPLNLRQTQEAIEPGTLLLSYYVDSQETYLFAVTNHNLKLFRLTIAAKDLNRQITEFQNQASVQRLGSPTDEVHKLGQQLYEALIGPAQDLVNQAKRVLVCPDGPLQALPFAALVSRNRPRVRYFIEDKPLHTIVSMTVYAETRKRETETDKQVKTLLAFGDPIYARQQVQGVGIEEERAGKKGEASRGDSETEYLRRRGLKLGERLPQTRKEVEEIGKLFGKSATIKLDREATETAARQESKNYTMVHFAVHGWLDEQIGLNSGILLSRPELLGKQATKDDNGLLQAWEIMEQVRLNADLVVLSGCETGLGQRLRGEGIIGLTRAIQYAGARSIVVSLWGVNDESTSVFMRAFYEELKRGASKDVALQKAMAVVRSNPKWSHPFFWSPFILVGSWN